ncbi:hypothetical protein [uncultured Microbacterium sp.]|nr:hypothetical protein [uncultured Microbacterium sp.]
MSHEGNRREVGGAPAWLLLGAAAIIAIVAVIVVADMLTRTAV